MGNVGNMKNKRVVFLLLCLTAVMPFFQNCGAPSELKTFPVTVPESNQGSSQEDEETQTPPPPVEPPEVPPQAPPVTPPATPPVTPADTTAPTISTITSTQVAAGDSTTATGINLAFSVTDSGSGVRSRECRISFNGTAQSYVACQSATAHSYSGLVPGAYIFRVRATDNSNNQSTREFSFSVTTSSGGGPVNPPSGGTTPPPSGAVSLGARWAFIGDSQTAGRDTLTYLDRLQSPVLGVLAVLSGVNGINGTSLIRGNGGQTLQYHRDSIYGSTSQISNPQTLTWVHFQESGGQTGGGQSTAREYAQTLKQFIENILVRSPNAVISTETAFSFGDARARQSGRNWGVCTSVMSASQCASFMDYSNCTPDMTGIPPASCTNYNLAQRAVIEHFRTVRNVTVYQVDVNALILQAETVFQPYQVWYQPYNATLYATWYPMDVDGSGLNYHYTFIGNLIVALGMYDALGYDVGSLTVNQMKGLFNDPQMSSSVRSLSDSDIQKILDLF